MSYRLHEFSLGKRFIYIASGHVRLCTVIIRIGKVRHGKRVHTVEGSQHLTTALGGLYPHLKYKERQRHILSFMRH